MASDLFADAAPRFRFQANGEAFADGETASSPMRITLFHLCPGTYRKAGWLMILRVFVFEPDDVVQEFLLLVLARRGYEFFAFERASVCAMGGEGRCVSPPGRPCADIIIADANRFGFPSFEILEHIAHGNCKVPNIALMSGTWLDVHRGYAQKLGCEIFDKPLHVSMLYSWLDECEQRIDPNRKLYDGFWADSHGKRNP